MNRRDFFRSSVAAAVAASLPFSRVMAAAQPIAADIQAVAQAWFTPQNRTVAVVAREP